MKTGITIGDIANAIDALKIAIEDRKCLIDSNLPAGRKAKKQREVWTQKEREDYEEWKAEIERFRALRKKLLAIEAGRNS